MDRRTVLALASAALTAPRILLATPQVRPHHQEIGLAIPLGTSQSRARPGRITDAKTGHGGQSAHGGRPPTRAPAGTDWKALKFDQ